VNAVEWDGKQWTNNRNVATMKTCIGPACGYNGGGAGSDIAGELDDGTLLLRSTGTGDNRLYLVE
jgi:hypothetical protein